MIPMSLKNQNREPDMSDIPISKTTTRNTDTLFSVHISGCRSIEWVLCNLIYLSVCSVFHHNESFGFSTASLYSALEATVG